MIIYVYNLKFQGCEFVIALTHMRTPNDKKLAEGVEDIDLILGGHDHVFEICNVSLFIFIFTILKLLSYIHKFLHSKFKIQNSKFKIFIRIFDDSE
jgi:hypothetical protein